MLVDFNAGKSQLISFDQYNNNGSIDVKMDGSVLEEKSSFKMLGLTFSSKLDWGSYCISIFKTTSKKIGALFRSMKCLSPEVSISINLPWTHVWNTAVTSGLVSLVAHGNCWMSYRTVGPSLAASLEPLAHCQNVASLSFFYRYYFCRCSSELAQPVSLPFFLGWSTCYSDRLHDFSVTIHRC